jgi:hypothetical protein
MEEFIGMRPPRPSCDLVHNFGHALSQQLSSGDAGATQITQRLSRHRFATRCEQCGGAARLEARGDVVCLICVSDPKASQAAHAQVAAAEASLSFPARDPNRPQWTRKCSFGLDRQSLLVSGKNDRDQNEDGNHRKSYCYPDRGCQPLDLRAHEICAECIDPDPDNGPSHVRNPKVAPRHVVRAGKEADDAAEQRHEAGSENDLAAMAHEEILADLDPRLAQMKIGAVTQQQPVSILAPDPKCDEISDGAPEDTRDQDRPDTQLLRRSRIESCCDENGLSWQRKAKAFQRYDRSDQPAAVNRDQGIEMMDQFGILEVFIN